MKLSIEATVAGAVAMAFAILSMAVIAQEQGERGAGGLNPGSPRASEISLSVQTDSGENQLLAQY
ncbi:MAG: hypothetical protein DMF07_02965 [Verrucomicrobia bacterium]|nr:MAG: hypothetical protein DMF07_02965 [Verrucomicrobiota bacterium]